MTSAYEGLTAKRPSVMDVIPFDILLRILRDANRTPTSRPKNVLEWMLVCKSWVVCILTSLPIFVALIELN
jgi:hypothetical protein